MFVAITQGIKGVAGSRPLSSKKRADAAAQAAVAAEGDGAGTSVEDELACETPYELWRLRAYLVLEDPSSSQAAKGVSLFILMTITVSIVNFMIASVPWDGCNYEEPANWEALGAYDWTRKCAEGGPQAGERLSERKSIQAVEMACIFIFTAEYFIRLSVCTAKTTRIRFITDPMNLLDVLAIMPWYIDTIVTAVAPDQGGGGNALGVLRIVRLTRVLRVFKVSKSMQSMIVLVRTLKRSFSAFMILLTSILVTMLLFGSFIVFFERGTYVTERRQYLRSDGTPSPFLSIPHCMYWCMTSMTTVGYGDMYPVTSLGQFVACAAMVCGIVVLSVPITVIGANFDEETREQHRINQLRKRVLQMEKLRIEDTLKASGVVTEAAVAGMQEINCLLDDYHQNVVGDVNMFVAKAEPTFTQLVRKVVIHSRVFADMSGPSSQTMTTGAVSPGTEVEVES